MQSTPVRFGTARHYAEVRAEELLLRSSRRRLAEPEAGRSRSKAPLRVGGPSC